MQFSWQFHRFFKCRPPLLAILSPAHPRYPLLIVIPIAESWSQFMMMDMSTMSTGMMLAAGIYHLAIFIFAVLGIMAAIKYLRS